MFELHLTAITL